MNKIKYFLILLLAALFTIFLPKIANAGSPVITGVNWTNNCGVNFLANSCKGTAAWTHVNLRNNTNKTQNVKILGYKFSCAKSALVPCNQNAKLAVSTTISILPLATYNFLPVLTQPVPQVNSQSCGSAQVDYFFIDPVTGLRSSAFWGFAFSGVNCPVKINPSITTRIQNARGQDITGKALMVDAFQDLAFVSGPTFTPTGSVTFRLYNNGTCSNSALSAQNVVLTVNNPSTASSSFFIPKAGQYSYKATYNGDSHYNAISASCETTTVLSPN